MSRIEKNKFEKITLMVLVVFFLNMVYLMGDSVGWRYILYMVLTLYSGNQITRWFSR